MSGNEAAWRLPEDMGAAELLRKLAGDLLLGDAALYDYLGYGREGFWGAEKGGVSICRTLESLADMVEREDSERRKRIREMQQTLNEALPAAKWVRSHGGLKECDRKVEASMEVADKYTLLRMELGKLLGYDLMGQLDTADEELVEKIGKRLMPEGMEWPRFEDGEPVRVGDRLAQMGDGVLIELDDPVDSVTFYGDGMVELHGDMNTLALTHGERVKRPEPKVLDADGVEIRVGDTVYDMVGDKHVVKGFGKQGDVLLEFHNDESLGWRPSNFTHRAPVLAADGKPLREGEHVYHVETGAELVVKELPKPGEYQAVVVFAPPASHLTSFDPDQLTHEQPDSWERLKDDATRPPRDYCGMLLNWAIVPEQDDAHYIEGMASDLVRRAKKLAGVER